MRFFSMFSGIGTGEKGIEQAFNSQSRSVATTSSTRFTGRSFGDAVERESWRHESTCVGFSEIDRHAEAIYRYHWPEHRNFGDATRIVCDELPDFDFLIAGFPCQAFSIAGKRQGFDDARGTLFFEIARVLSYKRPAHFVLENVGGLRSHDGGKTLQRILGVLSDLGYFVEVPLLNSKDYGVPQNRERVFFIGHLGERCSREILSIGTADEEHYEVNTRSEDISSCLDANYYKGKSGGFGGRNRQGIAVGTLRTHKDGEGFREVDSGNVPTIPARARQDGSGQPVIAIPVLTPEREHKRQNGRRMKEQGEARFTLTAQDRHGVLVSMNAERHGNRVYDAEGIAATITANPAGGTKNERYLTGHRIRLLTPIESERCQGCPDNFTKYGRYDDHIKEVADTNRYKGLGNSFTVNVIEAIISRMIEKGCLVCE